MPINSLFNVADYGATGEGTVDDSGALLATIAAAVSATSTYGYTTVVFPAGTYLYESSQIMTIPQNVGVMCTGSAYVTAPSGGGSTTGCFLFSGGTVAYVGSYVPIDILPSINGFKNGWGVRLNARTVRSSSIRFNIA